MPAIDIGDPLPNLAVRVENPPGTLVDVGVMTLTVTQPDGSSAVVPNTRTALGLYSPTAPVYATQGGLVRARWVGTGANACVKEQWRSVGDPVDIDELRVELKISTTATDDLVYRWVAAAVDEVERKSGRKLRQQTVVDVRPGGKYAVGLSQVPVQSVTSVVENGTALTAADYELNPQTGLLYRGTARSGAAWADGPTAVVVTYVAGSAVIPFRLRQAVVEYVRTIAAGYRGSSGQPQAGAAEDAAAKVADLVGARIPRF